MLGYNEANSTFVEQLGHTMLSVLEQKGANYGMNYGSYCCQDVASGYSFSRTCNDVLFILSSSTVSNTLVCDLESLALMCAFYWLMQRGRGP